jgi:adenine deaminase
LKDQEIYSLITLSLNPESHLPIWALNTIPISQPLTGADFRIEARTRSSSVTAKIIRILENSAIDEMMLVQLPVHKGEVNGDQNRDILKIAVIDRHSASGSVGKGLATGFGLKSGALDSTVCYD